MVGGVVRLGWVQYKREGGWRLEVGGYLVVVMMSVCLRLASPGCCLKLLGVLNVGQSCRW